MAAFFDWICYYLPMKKLFGSSVLFVLYVLVFMFTLRAALPAYVYSSFLSKITSDSKIGVIYAITSIFTILLFIFTPKLLKKYGNYKTILITAIINAVTLYFLSNLSNTYILILLFIITYSTTTIFYFCLDIFIEHNSKKDDVGDIRGISLTSANLAVLISPWLASLFLKDSNFSALFFISAIIMIPIILLISYNLKGFVDPKYDEFKFWKTLKQTEHNKNIRSILACNFLLQFFYSWMVIYAPIYLFEHMGFSWQEIGLIFFIMLLPFIFVQIPLGKLADKIGEKEMLAFGFIITAIATAIIPLITDKSFWSWSIVLLITRIGAAMIEVMSETYFFKKISDKSTGIISLYRSMVPVAYIVGPLLASLVIIFLPFNFIFFILGFIMLFGLRYSLALKDII